MGTVRICYASTLVEVGSIGIDLYVLGTERIIDIDFADSGSGHAGPTFACSESGWLQLSLNGGVSYTPVPTSIPSGISLGSFTAGQRKAAKLKVALPGSPAIGQRSVTLYVGEGT